MATLLPGLSLSIASGLSSPGFLCCLAMSLSYADLLYRWLCAHSLLDQGVRGLLACPSPSNLLWFCKVRWVLFSLMVLTLRDGVTLAGSRLVCPRSERRFSVFYLSLWAVFFMLSLPFGMKSPYWSGVLVSFLFCATDGCRWCCTLSPSGWASYLCLRLLFTPCHYRFVSWWSSLGTRVFGCP